MEFCLLVVAGNSVARRVSGGNRLKKLRFLLRSAPKWCQLWKSPTVPIRSRTGDPEAEVGSPRR
jgi:hypothetical protein